MVIIGADANNDRSEMSDKSSKYCGIGVTYHSPRFSEEGRLLDGIEIRHLPSARETPAQRAGLKDGDVLLAFRTDEREWRPLSDMGVYGMLAGAPGTELTLRILRGDQVFEQRLTRSFVYPISPRQKQQMDLGELTFSDEELMQRSSSNECNMYMSDVGLDELALLSPTDMLPQNAKSKFNKRG